LDSKIIIVIVAIMVIAAGAAVVLLLSQDSKSYPIEYDLDGGEFCTDYPQEYTSGKSIDLQYPIKDGRSFGGWYIDEGRTVHFNGDTKGQDGTLKLYARWTDSLIDKVIFFDVTGECERSLSSYKLTGYMTVYFEIQSKTSGLIHTITFDAQKYDYYDIGREYSTNVTLHEEWSTGLGDWGYGGRETISTVDGSVECDLYLHVCDDGAVEKRWIGDGGIIYKEYYEYFGDSGSDVQSMWITRTLTEYYDNPVIPDFKPQIYEGRGITVTGMKDSYQPGETATLTAKTDSGTKFGGWYGRNMELLSKDSTYSFEVGGEQVFYALDESDTILRYSKGDPINLSEVLKTEKGTWYRAHLNGTMEGASWNTETYSDLKTGTYLVTAKTPGGDLKAIMLQVGGIEQRTFDWKWNGKSYSVDLAIDFDDYVYAKNLYDLNDRKQDKPTHERDRTYVTYSCSDGRMSKYFDTLSETLIAAYKEKNTAIGTEDYLNYLLAFTQYIQYQSDEEFIGYAEYWKFPLETLYDQGGDCEDTSILFATLALVSKDKLDLDYKVGLQIMPGHACAAIRTSSVSGETNPYGYVYGETTSTNYALGAIPSKVKDKFLDPDFYPERSFTVEID